MSQYRFGTFTTTSTPTALTLYLGFRPDSFKLYNYTGYATDAKVATAMYFKGMPAGYALIGTNNATPVAEPSILTSNGFTEFKTGADWQNTQYVITGITNALPGVVTVSSISPTNTLTLVNGMTLTVSGVVGMTQLNTNRYIVADVSGSTFQLFDLFGNPVDTTAFGTYVSGGILNQISYPATAPVLGANGLVVTPGQPAGNQYDMGGEGIILGTSLFTTNAYVYYWEAWDQTPTGW